jgi:diguanylate cyclase (GGDEF)-like protein
MTLSAPVHPAAPVGSERAGEAASGAGARTVSPAAPKLLRTLIVDDSPIDAELIVQELDHHGYHSVAARVDTPAALIAALDSQEWDVIICDYTMPRFDGLAALKVVRARELDVPFLIVSGTIGEEIAVDAMRNGAHDYIMKDHLARLVPAIERELREASVRRERRRAEEHIQFLAFYDQLTGLPNVAQLLERLDRECAAGAGTQHRTALAMLNLSRFREVNETLGHHNGDALLQQVAQRLRRVQDLGGIAARIGGDEFAVLLPLNEQHDAIQAVTVILAALDPPFDVAGFRLTVDAKVGVAIAPDHGTDARQLLQRADVALSIARRRDAAVFVYDAAQDPSCPQQLMLVSDLRRAVDSGDLSVYFQPKVFLKDGQISGVEALARWTHPQRGLIGPDQFIPLAEKTGLIGALTQSVLDTTVRYAAVWRNQGNAIRVAVNLSPKNMADRAIVDRVDALLDAGAISADQLEFEITEGSLMEDPRRSIGVLRALSGMGIRLSIDDFGTGYSSLSYLQQLPVDAIKIDKSLVAEVQHHGDAAIVRSTIRLAHGLGLRVVAEGIESEAVLHRLTELGCDEAQGYFVAAPMAAESVGDWLAKHAAA